MSNALRCNDGPHYCDVMEKELKLKQVEVQFLRAKLKTLEREIKAPLTGAYEAAKVSSHPNCKLVAAMLEKIIEHIEAVGRP